MSDTISNEIKVDKTALSYWFPKLVEAGIPVPRTKIIKMPIEVQKVILDWFDGNDAKTGCEAAFFEELTAAAREMGTMSISSSSTTPCFLRTDHASAKHSWKATCYIESVENIRQHVGAIAMSSEMAGIIGLPWDTWVVREFLPTMPIGVCPRYGDMPVCREFRYFIEDGRYCCSHPYWPKNSLIDGRSHLSLAPRQGHLRRIDNPARSLARSG